MDESSWNLPLGHCTVEGISLTLSQSNLRWEFLVQGGVVVIDVHSVSGPWVVVQKGQDQGAISSVPLKLDNRGTLQK